MDEKNPLLNTRGSTHGEFSNNSHDTWRLMQIVMESRNWPEMPDQMRHALYMILHKVARAVDGNVYLKDHWDDMAGYANLVSNRINEEQTGLLPDHDRGHQFDYYTFMAAETGLPRDVVKKRVFEALYKPAPDELNGPKTDVTVAAGADVGALAAGLPMPPLPPAGAPVPAPQPEEAKPEGLAPAWKDIYGQQGFSFDFGPLKRELTFIRRSGYGLKVVELLFAEDHGDLEGPIFSTKTLKCKFTEGEDGLPVFSDVACGNTQGLDVLTGAVGWRLPSCNICKLRSSEPCSMVGNSEAIGCDQYRGNHYEVTGKK